MTEQQEQWIICALGIEMGSAHSDFFDTYYEWCAAVEEIRDFALEMANYFDELPADDASNFDWYLAIEQGAVNLADRRKRYMSNFGFRKKSGRGLSDAERGEL